MEEYSEKKHHCHLKFIVTLKIEKVYMHLNRYTEGTEVTVTVRKRGKVYLSSKHQITGDLGGMRYPNRLLSKFSPLCTCNYPFYSA